MTDGRRGAEGAETREGAETLGGGAPGAGGEAPAAPRKPRRGRIAGVVVSGALALAVAAFAITAVVDPWGDPHARAGYYDGKSDAEIEADLNESVEWYSMQVSVAPFAVASPGSTRIEGLNVENIEANHCDQRFTLSLKGTGEVLYESGAVRPGEYVPDVEIAHGFDEGTYTLVAEFQGYERQARLGGGGQLWGHDEFGAPARAEVLLIVTDDEQEAVRAALDYLS